MLLITGIQRLLASSHRYEPNVNGACRKGPGTRTLTDSTYIYRRYLYIRAAREYSDIVLAKIKVPLLLFIDPMIKTVIIAIEIHDNFIVKAGVIVFNIYDYVRISFMENNTTKNKQCIAVV